MDYQVFLQILKSALIKYRCVLHAYCLMTNHIHLLLETCDMEIGKFMKHLSECYAMYVNHKYSYMGHVFESRYKSCLVEEDAFFSNNAVFRYREFVEDIGHKYVVQEQHIRKMIGEDELWLPW